MRASFVFLLICFDSMIAEETVVITLPIGTVLGLKSLTAENNTIYIFQKIPYAEPPVGKLRFQAPQPHRGWKNILDARKLDITCFQTTLTQIAANETEDCLVLNVLTPKLPNEIFSPNLPVMFYIHGGGFVEGSSDLYFGERFVDHGVILVTMNYRLGPFGFLSTQDKTIPGNLGLKDQQQALDFVHKYIYLFGGDPKKITIFGESAGSASVAYQLLNRKNKGKIFGAILQSGTFLCPWAFQRRAKTIAFETAAMINSTFRTNRNSKDLLQFLISVDAKTLDFASEEYRKNFVNNTECLELITGFHWAPVLEVSSPSAFLTQKMYQSLQNGHILQVPTIIGMNSEEGILFNQNQKILEKKLEKYEMNVDWLVPENVRLKNIRHKKLIGTQIRSIYLGDQKSLKKNHAAGIKFTSDTAFTRSIIKHATLYSKIAKTYFYEFSHHGTLPNFNFFYNGTNIVTHAEELKYLFCFPGQCDISWAPKIDQLTSYRFLKLWTNFAKFQNPTPDLVDNLLENVTWPRLSIQNGDFVYLDFNKNLKIRNHLNERYFKWNQIYSNLNFSDFDTF